MVTAPTLLNPRLAVSLHDLDAARIFYEPLASFDKYGALIPILAREVPPSPSQAQAHRHGAISSCGVQTRRSDPRRSESAVSRTAPAVFRQSGGEGRRGFRLGGARGAADGRLRLRWDHDR